MRFHAKKLDSLFDITRYLTPLNLGIKGDCKIISTGISSYSTKHGVMSNDPKVIQESEVVHTGKNSMIIGAPASLTERGSKPGKVKVFYPESKDCAEIDLTLAVTAYPEGYLINSGKQTTSIFGTRNNAYFSSIGKRNFKCSSADGARVFPSTKAVADYLEKKKDIFRYMVTEYGYEFSVEPTCSLFAESLSDIPQRDQKYLDRLEQLLNEINADELAEDEPTESGIASDEEIKAEALKRLQKLNVMGTVVEGFKRGKLFMSEFGGILYDLNDKAAYAAAEAKSQGLLPYAVCRSQTNIGDMYTILAVSEDKEDWTAERPNRNGECVAFVYNADHPECSNYGTVVIESANGGLIRTA